MKESVQRVIRSLLGLPGDPGTLGRADSVRETPQQRSEWCSTYPPPYAHRGTRPHAANFHSPPHLPPHLTPSHRGP